MKEKVHSIPLNGVIKPVVQEENEDLSQFSALPLIYRVTLG